MAFLRRVDRIPAYLRCYHVKNCFGYRGGKDVSFKVSQEDLSNRNKHPNVWRLISAYREHGHKKARLDPLGLAKRQDPSELKLGYYGLGGAAGTILNMKGLLSLSSNKTAATLSEVVQHLEELYCDTMTIETAQIESSEEREWVSRCYEQHRATSLSDDRKRSLAKLLVSCETFDHFLAKKFGTLKRYGGEGAESMMGFFDEAFKMASSSGVSDVVIAMPHRGRLNLLTEMLGYPAETMFHKIQGKSEYPEGLPTTGDVLSHLVSSVDLPMGDGRQLHVTMVPNPSHLEAVNPVAVGKARGKLLSKREGPYGNKDTNPVLSLQVHGDAAFQAQGVVMETLGMSRVSHFEVGGTVHLIVNNQIGYTTPDELGRSSAYCSDIGKMIGCPVIHVNGDYPEDVVRASNIAMQYWSQFHKDIIIDLVCFRRWGHNELDNPSFTQPLMYDVINNRASVPNLYTRQLESAGVLESGYASRLSAKCFERLNQKLKEAEQHKPKATHLQGLWQGMMFPSDKITSWDTGCPIDLLKYVGAKSVEFPSQFTVHPKLLQSHVQDRLAVLEKGSDIDWATGEALAIGTLLYQGFNVRISGQDVGRGTFSQRHAMLVDQKTDAAIIPLNNISGDQTAFLEVANCPLNEEAVLGYEYGFSMDSPKHLALWEAQFGDFFNGAQIMIDTFVSSGEAKWLLQSSLVMLLPHGYDGAGPEHSSCRIERFLQLCDSKETGSDGDSVNTHIAHPTTPAQYYHLLRRQMVRNFRKPLIVASPKVLLRLPAAVSSLEDMAPGTSFKPVLGDTWTTPDKVTRVVLCSGKHFYALDAYRKEKGLQNTALIRLELLSPFPAAYIHEELARYPHVKEFIWSQEEPQNMGPWSFVEPRFRRQLDCKLSFVGRKPSAPPAVAVSKVHSAEAQKLLTDTFPVA